MAIVTINDLQSYLQTISDNLVNDYSFRPDNVYQIGSAENREIIGQIVERFLLPGSRIDNAEILAELLSRCRAGQSCLILAEHYSNFDFPMIYRLTEKNSLLGPEAAKSFLPIRGMKLSEVTPFTAPFTRSYDTIVIYPSRSLDKIKDPEKLEEVRKISLPINHAAMRQMIKQKHNGRIIVVFPAGTRYRPWDKSSMQAVREIHSYLKTFDNVMFMAINGNTLPPAQTEVMTDDTAVEDLMILTCSEIVNGRQFLKKEQARTPEGIDPKQYAANRVMEKLMAMHNKVEAGRIAEKAALDKTSQ